MQEQFRTVLMVTLGVALILGSYTYGRSRTENAWANRLELTRQGLLSNQAAAYALLLKDIKAGNIDASALSAETRLTSALVDLGRSRTTSGVWIGDTQLTDVRNYYARHPESRYRVYPSQGMLLDSDRLLVDGALVRAVKSPKIPN